MLWPEEYYRPCPARTINGKTYNDSQLFEKVEGFNPVSELTLIKQNKGGDLWSDYVKHFRAYKISDLGTYMSDSYSKAYTRWHNNACVRTTSNNSTETIGPGVVEGILDGPCYWVIFNVYLISWLLVILIFA